MIGKYWHINSNIQLGGRHAKRTCRTAAEGICSKYSSYFSAREVLAIFFLQETLSECFYTLSCTAGQYLAIYLQPSPV